METEDHGARPAGIERLGAPTPQELAEVSGPLPLCVGSWLLLLLLDALLRQERLLAAGLSAECGEEGAARSESGLAASRRAGWTLLTFSEDDPSWSPWPSPPSSPLLLALAFPFCKAES